MYCVLPPSLQSLLEFARDVTDNDDCVLRFIDEFLKGLSALGIKARTLKGLRRHLQILGTVSEPANKGATDLESLLRQHDLWLGPELGGFANLFKSASEHNDIFSGDSIDFEGLDNGAKVELAPLGEAAEAISSLEDLAEIRGLQIDRVAACILFEAASKWLTEESVYRFMRERTHLSKTLRLYSFREEIENLSADFVLNQLQSEDFEDFCLWFLSRFLSGQVALAPLQRPLVDTILKKAELGSLAAFERAGFMP